MEIASIPHVNVIASLLRSHYHNYAHGNLEDPLEEILFILCSLKTREGVYQDSYAALRSAFPDLAMLDSASTDDIALVLSAAGLSHRKAEAIKAIVRTTTARFGSATLEPLRAWNNEECEQFLTSFPFVGVKTARCVMMYSLGREVFPVDTHCWRISQRLGWVQSTKADGSCRPEHMDRLQSLIPPHLRFTLHVNMVSLGRELCLPRKPKCYECPICEFCPKIGASVSQGE